MTSPITPDTVRALLADTGSERWRAINGVDDPDPAWGSFPMVVTEPSGAPDDGGDEVAIVRNRSNEDAALMAASKRIALAYLAVCAERDRLARVLAVEQGDEGAAGDGWRITSTGEGWRSRSDAYVYRIARGRWVVARVHGGAVCADLMTYPNALEAMEAADRAGGSDV